MKAPDFSGKADAELMRFCSATSHTLTKLSRQIAAGIPGLQTAFDEHAELLNAAISELDNRYPDSHRDED